MNVVELSDYKTNIVEKICLDKFENDIMLVFNNFSKEAIMYVVEKIKRDIKDFEAKGVVFDCKLIKICCSMYLGIAWSMYKKGKNVQKDNMVIQSARLFCSDESVQSIVNVVKTTKVMEVISDIVMRYFTLYLSRHINDILDRMEISYHPEINDEKNLKKVFLEYLRSFAMKVLAVGIIDESKKYKH